MGAFRFKLVLLAVASVAPLASAQDAAKPVTAESLEKTADRLFQAQKATSSEAAEWQQQRKLFTELIEIRKAEIAKIEASTSEARDYVEQVRERSTELTTEEQERKRWRRDFEQQVAGLEERIRPVLPMLPKPLRDQVGQSATRLEQPAPEADLQERFRDVLAILAAVQDFSDKITIATEIREIGGRETEIEVLYLGMNQAWYSDRAGKVAGTGRPDPSGWVWEEDASVGRKVREVIAIHRKELPPAMARLPFLGNK